MGYVNVRIDGERKSEAVLAIDPEQGPLLLQAFELYATGEYTVRSLQMEMAARGLHNRYGSPVSRARIAELLHNMLYIGIVVHDGVEYQGAHEPLVPRKLFDRVQQVFGAHDRGKVRQTKHPHFLRGFLFCASCGSRLSSMTAKGRYSYFYCLGRFTGRTDCREPYIAIERAEEAVEEVYRGLVIPPVIEDKLRESLEQELADEVSLQVESLATARRRLAKATHERERLLQAYLADALPLDVLKREQKRVTQEIGLAEEEISRAEAAESPYGELLDVAMSLICDARERYTGADAYGKRLWNQSLLERVEVKSGQITRVELKPPFEDLFLLASSNKGSLVGETVFEFTT